MKILIIGDLHGRKPRIHFKEFDCIIQVGDVCDDRSFRPYLKKWFNSMKKDKDNALSDDNFIIDEIGEKGLRRLERDSLKRGREVLKYLNSFGKPVFIVPGNWDQSYGKTKIKDMDKSDYNYLKAFYDFYLGDKINPALIKGLKNIKDCQFKSHEFDEINFFGYGLSSGYEHYKRRRKLNITKQQHKDLKKAYFNLLRKLFERYKQRNKKYPTIFISHNIPRDTKLDIVRNKENYANNMHLGSSLARKFCEKYQPLLCIGGHVHESPGKDKIGKTILINPGFGRDAQVLIDIDENKGKIRNINFYGKNK